MKPGTHFDFKLGRELRIRFFLCAVGLLVAALMLLRYTYGVQVRQDEDKARTIGESIMSSIMVELRRCHDTTQLINDLYKATGQVFLDNFKQISAELLHDNLAIGSMYWVPDGIIRYAYPDEVTEATANFNCLEDPIQGSKARLAKDSGKATIAGPHHLVEGGIGFVYRNPNYDDDGQFVGFSTMVIDCEEFMRQVVSNLGKEELEYRFAVWKEPDTTAVLLHDRYILESDGPIEDCRVTLSFNTSNDRWHLVLEPTAGWSPLSRMLPTCANILVLYVVILGILLIVMYNQQMNQDRKLAEKEIKRLNEVEKLNAELQRQQQETEEARRIAEAASQAKSSFLFNMSHDIRTPMNAIIGFRNLLEKHQDNPEKRNDYLRKIEESSIVLLSIINNVLEMACIEKGTVEIEDDATNIDQFYETLYSIFHELMEQKGLSFTYQLEVKHHHLHADITKMREIFLNIISNAYKYTHPGGKVHMRVEELPGDTEGCCHIRTTISDTGKGMSEEFLPHLFEEFTREHNTTDIKIEGTGLGMPIVKRLVKLLGGTIEVESQLGVGSTFTVTIPHLLATETETTGNTPDAQPTLSPGKRILLAEDNELNAEIAMEILSEVGFIVERATDGQEAVDRIKQAPEGYYDLILMDIQMPNMNGYEATMTIRSMPEYGKAHIPILAVTANAFEEDKRKAINVGMNGHLSKPIHVDELIMTMNNTLNNEHQH